RDVAKDGIGAIALLVDDFRLLDFAVARHHDTYRNLKSASAKGVEIEAPVPHDLLTHEVAHAVGGLVSGSRGVAGRGHVGLSRIVDHARRSIRLPQSGESAQ